MHINLTEIDPMSANEVVHHIACTYSIAHKTARQLFHKNKDQVIYNHGCRKYWGKNRTDVVPCQLRSKGAEYVEKYSHMPALNHWPNKRKGEPFSIEASECIAWIQSQEGCSVYKAGKIWNRVIQYGRGPNPVFCPIGEGIWVGVNYRQNKYLIHLNS